MNSSRFVEEEIDAQVHSSGPRVRGEPAPTAPEGAVAPEPSAKDVSDDDLYADVPCTD